jgi:hypothetical protein
MNMKRLMKAFFSHDFLVRFQWYRKEQGGFWVRGNVFGWRKSKDWNIESELSCCKNHPELYRNGKDIEDYRRIFPND